ncbi:hypothetical protein [Bacillus toyonensis]|uniref:hypothetical protein n=1 Tax=Bacillus toyonensis TaxID=155322 RepID=UPI00027955D0|nr:hypothetical protein [Bacillus toyonensis]MDP9744690.1 translation initiation factor 2 beta subunit (eIF-2beta)/eIF-5/transcriptional regulator with XRE-family HTH domain [Bacillus thuringiensis]EJQ91272.1 hypothetical protein IGO_01068 [Bacillus toyonensis]HDR7223719.1 hypothetical protein [Bacillus toyonensis]HDR7346730.1 hypothetical protein [Bacillus toyonensis]HDR7835206.1 hypothetical protein [Bacillus toyonensis]
MKLYESNLTCPECGRFIKNIPDDSYAFKKNKDFKLFEGVCSYCYFQSYYDFHINNAKLFDSMGLSPHVPEPYYYFDDFINEYRLDKIPNQLEIYDSRFQMEYRKYFEVKFFREYLTPEDNFESLANKIYCVKSKGICLFDELYGIRTENNLAVIFFKRLDKNFIHINGGINTELEFYLHKEIFDSFKLITLEDYIYKYKSCKILERLDNNDVYINKAIRIKNEALKKFNIDNNTFDLEYKQITKRDFILKSLLNNEENNEEDSFPEEFDEIDFLKNFIFTDIRKKFDKNSGFRYSLRNNNLSIEQKIAVFNNYLTYVEAIREGIFIVEGQKDLQINLSDLGIAYYTKTWELDFANSINESYILFEGWQLTDNEQYLSKSLDKINKHFQEHLLDKISWLGGKKPNNYLAENLNLLESFKRLCGYYTFFNEKFGTEIKELQLKGAFKNFTQIKLKKTRYSILLSDDLEANLIVLLADMIEPGILYREIIKKYINKLESIEHNPPHELIIEIRELYHEFLGVFEKMIYILYKSKSTFEDLIKNENNEIDLTKYIVNIINQISERIVHLNNQETIQNSDLLDLFEFKKDQFSLIPIGIENYTVLESIENLLNSLHKLLIEKLSERPDLNAVVKELESELGEAICNKLGENLKTLATAEYLYKIFVLDSSNDDEYRDYSCISILYYKALETSLNHLIYKPYIDQHFSSNKDWDFVSSQPFSDYFPVSDTTKFKKYYFYKENTTGNFFLSNELTLGNMGNFLRLRRNNNPSQLISFFSDIVKPHTNLVNELRWLSTNILAVKDNRNNAAHGGSIISKTQVIQDKQNVFLIDSAIRYKKILIRLLNILG